VSRKLDAGPICMKKKIELHGSAKRIYTNMEAICLEMIKKLIENKDIKFKKQIGKETFYKKRTPSDSELKFTKSIKENFNLLRISNNEKWPAFFYYKKTKYIIKIFKDRF